MYYLETAVLMAKVKPTGLNEVDVSNFSLKELLENYKTGYLVLTNDYLQGEVFLTLEAMRATDLGMGTFDITVTTWLKNTGTKTLPHVLTEPTYKFTKLNYADCAQAGYNRSAVHPYSTIEGYPLSSLTDLYLRKDGVDSSILNANSLFVVNGYLHTHDIYKEGVKITDATKSMMYAKKNHLGVISFNGCGGVKHITLKPEMIHRSSDSISLYQELVLELGVPLKGKGVLLSIAGMFIYSNDVYKITDEDNGIIVVNLARLNLLDRVQQAIKFIDFPEMLLHSQEDNITQLDKDTILSDAFIMAILRMSQTCVMVTEQPHHMVKREPVNYQGVYGRYFSHRFDYDIMVDSFGRIVPYFYYGNQSHPFMVDKHIFQIPLEFAERQKNIARRHDWRYKENIVHESMTNLSEAMPVSWLDIEFIKPA